MHFFVNPITRQTNPDAQVQNCSDRNKNLFQFNMEDENSWLTITPTLEHRKLPAVFGPKVVTLVSRGIFGGERVAGIYTRAQLSEFSDKIPISAASRKSFAKNLSRTHRPQHGNHGPQQYPYYAAHTFFYVDNMISHNQFKNQFMDTCGSIAYVFEFCGNYFS